MSRESHTNTCVFRQSMPRYYYINVRFIFFISIFDANKTYSKLRLASHATTSKTLCRVDSNGTHCCCLMMFQCIVPTNTSDNHCIQYPRSVSIFIFFQYMGAGHRGEAGKVVLLLVGQEWQSAIVPARIQLRPSTVGFARAMLLILICVQAMTVEISPQQLVSTLIDNRRASSLKTEVSLFICLFVLRLNVPVYIFSVRILNFGY